jgi:hypothetical protein
MDTFLEWSTQERARRISLALPQPALNLFSALELAALVVDTKLDVITHRLDAAVILEVKMGNNATSYMHKVACSTGKIILEPSELLQLVHRSAGCYSW